MFSHKMLYFFTFYLFTIIIKNKIANFNILFKMLCLYNYLNYERYQE